MENLMSMWDTFFTIYWNYTLWHPILIEDTMYSLIEKLRKMLQIYIKFFYHLGSWYIMTAKIQIRQDIDIIFIVPRKFDAADVKCFTILSFLRLTSVLVDVVREFSSIEYLRML